MADFSGMDDPFADMDDPFAVDDQFAGMDDPFADMDDPFAAASAPAEDAAEPGMTFEDFGRSVMAGGAEVGAGAGWLMNRAGELVDSQGLRVHGKAIEEMSRDSAESWNAGMSEGAQAINQQTFLKETDDPESWTGYELGDAGFAKVGMMLGQSLLGTAAGMGAGAGITGALKILPGVSKGVAATLGYSSGEALVAAPSSGFGAEAEVRAMGEEDFAGHPEYESLVMQGDDFETAKEKLAKAAGGDAAIMTAISTAVLSSPFGKYLDKWVGGEAGSMMGGLLKGGGTEAVQETFQSGAEQASINQAIKVNADIDRSLMEGVPEAMVGGFAAGGAMGGGMGAVSGRAAGIANAEEAAQQAADAARAAGGDDLDAELARQGVFDQAESGTEMPLDPYMPAEWTDEVQPEAVPNPFAERFNQMPLSPQDEAMQAMGAEEQELAQSLEQRALEEGKLIQGGPIQIGPITAADGFTQDEFLPYEQDRRRQALADQLAADEQQAELESEQASFDQADPGREPLEPVSDEELGPPAKPARQEMEAEQILELADAIDKINEETPDLPKGNAKHATPEMELSQAIATLGGLNRDEASLQGVDPEQFNQRAGGIARIFTKGGKTFDEMAEALNELGFFDDSPEGYNPNTLLEKLTKSIKGEPQHSPQSTTAAAIADSKARIDDIDNKIAALAANYDDDQDSPPRGQRYQGLDEDEQGLAYTVMEAELAGVDPMTLDMLLDEDIPVTEIDAKIRRNIANATGKAQPADKSGDQGDTAAPQGKGTQEEGPGQEAAAEPPGAVDEHGYRIPEDSELDGLYEQVLARDDVETTGPEGIQKQFNIDRSTAVDLYDRVQAELLARENAADPEYKPDAVRSNKPETSANAAENEPDLGSDTTDIATDMFGAVPAAEQSLADLRREKDEKRSGTKDVPADIDGGLFSNQDGQMDIEGQAPGPGDPPAPAAPAAPVEADNTEEFLASQTDLEAEFLANTAEAEAREADVIASVNEPGPSIFKNETGTVFYSVTPTANGDQKYQVTVWDKDGAVSDSKHNTAENIASYYRSELYGRATEEEFNALQGPKGEEFTLGQVEQDNTPTNNMVEYTPAADRESEHARIAELLKDKTPVQLAKMLVNGVAGVNLSGLTNAEMIQRINMARDAVAEMVKYKSVKQWQDAIAGEPLAAKERVQAWADMVDPQGAKNRSAMGTDHNTAEVASAIAITPQGGKLPRYTAEEKVAQDKFEADGFAKADEDRSALDKLIAKAGAFMTAAKGKEIASWWNAVGNEERGLMLDVLGYSTDKRRKNWIKRTWDDHAGKQGLPNEAKSYARQYAQTFWEEFSKDPAAYVENHALPTERPSLGDSPETLEAILEANAAGLLVNESPLNEQDDAGAIRNGATSKNKETGKYFYPGEDTSKPEAELAADRRRDRRAESSHRAADNAKADQLSKRLGTLDKLLGCLTS